MKYTAAKLSKKIDELIAYCDVNGEPPAAHIVRIKLGVSEKELDYWRSGEAGSGFKEAVGKLDDYRTYFWLRKGLDDPKWASFSTFNLKQSINGGYTDKPSADARELQISVRMDGVGPDAFK